MPECIAHLVNHRARLGQLRCGFGAQVVQVRVGDLGARQRVVPQRAEASARDDLANLILEGAD